MLQSDAVAVNLAVGGSAKRNAWQAIDQNMIGGSIVL